eukprot:TRINITY_DN645_c0_g1_i2.p1 TRINITY_DN645_c0_g1~~TRINITY_DN645_c0_g1_i2.p1  ORF type:complete len:578 (-),score=146.46 TRINITY_DN645_c0_g1_i2:786-2519(-)
MEGKEEKRDRMDDIEAGDFEEGERISPRLSSLPPESEIGNIEYKRHICPPDRKRFDTLVSQLGRRLDAGDGQAIYLLGVEDDGRQTGISREEMDESIKVLRQMAAENDAEVFLTEDFTARLNPARHVCRCSIRHHVPGDFVEVRVAVCGNVDTGKSTLIGVLTHQELDDGNGKMRASIQKLLHELRRGVTSSISHAVLGYHADGTIVNDGSLHDINWRDVARSSSRLIHFIDLAGHEKYLRTTCHGLNGQNPEYSLVLVSPHHGVTHMTKKHVAISLALKLPLIFMITRIDSVPKDKIKQTKEQVAKLCKQFHGHRAQFIRTEDEVGFACEGIDKGLFPVFFMSNKTGEGKELFEKFLFHLPSRTNWEERRDLPTECLIDETFHVRGVGTVVSVFVTQGRVKKNDQMWIGPDSTNKFVRVKVRSIRVQNMDIDEVYAGWSATFSLPGIARDHITKSMVLLKVADDPKAVPHGVWEFEADILVMHGQSGAVRNTYEPVVHLRTIRQVARINLLGRDVIRAGERSNVRFRFCIRPEYVRVGDRLILREGSPRGLGVVTRVIDSRSAEFLRTSSDRRGSM